MLNNKDKINGKPKIMTIHAQALCGSFIEIAFIAFTKLVNTSTKPAISIIAVSVIIAPPLLIIDSTKKTMLRNVKPMPKRKRVNARRVQLFAG